MRIEVGDLRKPQWIRVYEDGRLVCSIWGRGVIRYYDDGYMLCVKDGDDLSIAFVHFKKGELKREGGR